MVMLGVQALPYSATFATACISAMSNKPAEVVAETPPIVQEAA
jgi:hypothetical protein